MDDIAESTAGKQRGRPFQKGKSGNPNGRPKGARNQATLAAESLLDGEIELVTRKAIELAKKGNMAAIRLVLERVLPPRRESPVYFNVPQVGSLSDIPTAVSSVLQAVGEGELTPNEGKTITAMLEHLRRGMEAEELENRIEVLEESLAQHGNSQGA